MLKLVVDQDDGEDNHHDDQVEQDEAEIFLTPGMTWSSTGDLAQAQVPR